MNKTIKTVLQILLSLGLAAGVLYFVFRKVDWQAFYQQSAVTNYNWILLSMFVGVFSYLLRAYRWMIMFYPVGHRPGLFRTFIAVMSGYLANLLIPRLGEVTRCGVLHRTEKIPVSVSLGTVITERLVDVLTLGVLLLFTLLIEYEKIMQFMATTMNWEIEIGWVVPTIVLCIGALGAWIFFKYIYRSDTRIGAFSRGVVDGLISLRKVNWPRFLLSTLGIWLVYYLMTFLTVFALPETAHLPWQVGFSMLVAGVVAFVLPVQSGFGTFHALVSTMLIAYGIGKDPAVFLATVLHASQLLVVLMLGLFSGLASIFLPSTSNDQGKNSE